ncbi:MAG: hypothetical protein QXP98_05285 [Thermoproteus sp.]
MSSRRALRGLEALETAILLAISLAIIFGAVPYIIQTIYQIEASLEAKNYAAFLVALADSLESDFGMAGVQRMYQLPNSYFGTFYVRAVPLKVVVQCGAQTYTYYFKELVVGYNSTYVEFGNSMLRGLNGSLAVPIGEPVVALNSTYPRSLRLYSRVVYVNGSSLYLYTISASFVPQGSGRSLAYTIGPLNYTSTPCNGLVTVVASSGLGSKAITVSVKNGVYLVWNNVTFYWK